ncbi:EAL domain-containing protein [Herbaspirillum robiniae]|uniref:EAL domain-containing protein n=1 Tax=Herbaspirillum robiniae TaxID=2014887 RepID=UPI003D781DD8
MIKARYIPIAAAAALGVAALLLPVWIGWSWSWQRTLSEERGELNRVGAQVAYQGHAILRQAAETLRYFQQLRLPPCSDAHIARMRASTIGTRMVDEIGYYRDGRLACNTWGRVGETVMLEAAFTLVEPNLQLRAASFSLASPAARMIGLYSRGHYVYIEPGRFVDVPLEGDVQVAVFSVAGDPIVGRNEPDWAAARRVAGGARAHDDERLFSALADRDFKIVVSTPMARVQARLRHERLALLPLSLLAWALALAAIATWLGRRLSLVGELRTALARGDLAVHYQPIVELHTGRCRGAEALVRWRHPSGRWIAPDEFIPLAERHGMAGRITRHVLRTVLADMGAMLRADAQLHIALNLSPQDMRDGVALDTLSATLAGTGVACRQIWLEATERGFMDVDAARLAMARARQRGHVVAIDDFGTGYSSLSYLQALPLDVLKIDKSFVDKIGTDSASSTVINHIIEMARSLRLMMVAEGIETQEQADWLRRHEVGLGQGWLFARAMPAPDFIAFLREREYAGPQPEAALSGG